MNKIYVIRRKSEHLMSDFPISDKTFHEHVGLLSKSERSNDDKIMVYVSSLKKANWWCGKYSEKYPMKTYNLTPGECSVLSATRYYMDVYYYYIDTIEVL